jgi:hypothetical protein
MLFFERKSMAKANNPKARALAAVGDLIELGANMACCESLTAWANTLPGPVVSPERAAWLLYMRNCRADPKARAFHFEAYQRARVQAGLSPLPGRA